LVLGIVWMKRSAPPVEIVADAGADYLRVAASPEHPGEERVELRKGGLRVRVPARAVDRPFVLVTSHGRLVVSGSRFTIETSKVEDVVSVSEGSVRFEDDDRHREIGAGQSLHTSAFRIGPAISLRPTVPLAVVVPGCDVSPKAATACYRAVADGAGASAQNALYALALRHQLDGERASSIAELTEYARRFPDGILAPDAAWTLIGVLLAEHRYMVALEQARAFAHRFPFDDRRADVALLGAHLLRDQLLSLPEAAIEYERVLALEPPHEVEDEALFYLGVCRQALGERKTAAEIFARHLAKFPTSRFAKEDTRRLRIVE
jgi:TolA-binding protein